MFCVHSSNIVVDHRNKSTSNLVINLKQNLFQLLNKNILQLNLLL